MTQSLNSKVRAKVWLTPDQVDDLLSRCYSTGADYLQHSWVEYSGDLGWFSDHV